MNYKHLPKFEHFYADNQLYVCEKYIIETHGTAFLVKYLYISCVETENAIEFMIKRSRNKYNKCLKNIDKIFDDNYIYKVPISNDYNEGDHGGLKAQISVKRGRLELENAAINNKWSRNKTFVFYQTLYSHNPMLFETIFDYAYSNALYYDYEQVKLNREDILLKISEYEDKLLKTKKQIEKKQKEKATKILSETKAYNSVAQFEIDKLLHKNVGQRKEFCKQFIRRIKLLYKDQNDMIKALRSTKVTDNNKRQQKTVDELTKMCHDCIQMENKMDESSCDSTDVNMDGDVFNLTDLDVFSLKLNKYGLSNGYCYCLNKYLGQDMIFCDECSIWYHCICLGITEKQFALLQKQEEYICPRCLCKS